MFRSKPLLLFTIGVSLAAGGCSSSRYHNDDGSLKPQNYPADGYLGMTSVNPNDPMNPTHHHYRDDFRLVTQLISQLPHVQDSTINFNGARADVYLELQKGVSEPDADRVREQAFQVLSQNMPRYQVQVTTTRR